MAGQAADPAPPWLQAHLEQEAERMARKGLIRQYGMSTGAFAGRSLSTDDDNSLRTRRTQPNSTTETPERRRWRPGRHPLVRAGASLG